MVDSGAPDQVVDVARLGVGREREQEGERGRERAETDHGRTSCWVAEIKLERVSA